MCAAGMASKQNPQNFVISQSVYILPRYGGLWSNMDLKILGILLSPITQPFSQILRRHLLKILRFVFFALVHLGPWWVKRHELDSMQKLWRLRRWEHTRTTLSLVGETTRPTIQEGSFTTVRVYIVMLLRAVRPFGIPLKSVLAAHGFDSIVFSPYKCWWLTWVLVAAAQKYINCSLFHSISDTTTDRKLEETLPFIPFFVW